MQRAPFCTASSISGALAQSGYLLHGVCGQPVQEMALRWHLFSLEMSLVKCMRDAG